MAKVSVADVENLRDIFTAMQASYSLAKESFERDMADLNTLYDRAEQDCFDAVRNLELAESNVNNCAFCLQEKENELSSAQDDLAVARDNLAAAQSLASEESDYEYE